MVVGAAGTIALALSEFQDRGLTTHTKMAGGEAIAKLYKLRQYMIGTWDFDTIARTHGRAVLREACGSDVSTRSSVRCSLSWQRSSAISSTDSDTTPKPLPGLDEQGRWRPLQNRASQLIEKPIRSGFLVPGYFPVT